MTKLLLDYPDNVDICAYGLPLPVNINSKGCMMLIFPDDEEYWSYVSSICEILDNLEYAYFFKFERDVINKIRFCKMLLKRLVDVLEVTD